MVVGMLAGIGGGFLVATRRTLAAVALLCVLAGCATGVVYNRLDWLVSWYVGGFVSLDDAQEAELRRVVHRTLDWHRRTQLPSYIAFLDRLAEEAAQPADAATMQGRYDQVAAFMDDFIRQVIPEVVPLLRTLDPEQIAELRDNLEEDNEELLEEYGGATETERSARRDRNALRTLQRFVGRLDAGQRTGITSTLAGMHDLADSWIERRRNWQAQFLRLLETQPPDAQFIASLQDLALNPDQFDSADYRSKAEDNRRLIMRMLADLSRGLHERQRAHLRDEFREMAADLQAIAGSG